MRERGRTPFSSGKRDSLPTVERKKRMRRRNLFSRPREREPEVEIGEGEGYIR